MAGLLDELRDIEKACDDAAQRLSKPDVADWLQKLRESVKAAAAAFSGSWIGYHAATYIRDLRPRTAADVFDAEWGIEPSLSGATGGDWVTYDRPELERVIVERTGVSKKKMLEIEQTAREVGKVFDHAKGELLPILDALIAEGHASPAREAREALAKLKSHVPVANLVEFARPKQWASRDQAAMAGGIVVPVHVLLAFRVEETASYGARAAEVATHACQVRKYLERRSALAATVKPDVASGGMTKKTGGWDPVSFEEVVAQLDATTMKIALRVKGTRTCPAPKWDPDRAYRVILVGDASTIQRLVDGNWEAAPLEPPPKGEASMSKKERTTETRLFISHAYADEPLARALTELVDGTLTVSKTWMRCTSVVGFKLEPGADGPDELRANLEDAEVVIGLLTPASLDSAYVLMELGAAWGLKTWTVPLLGSGVGFKELPGPIGRGVHAIKVDDDEGVASLLETISTRCGMDWRVAADRRHALVKRFVEAAKALPSKPDSAPAAATNPAAVAPPPPDMSSEDRVGALRVWLHDLEERNDPRAKGRPFRLDEVDAEANVSLGTAATHLERALDQDWEILRRDGVFIELLYSPKIRDVRGSRRYR